MSYSLILEWFLACIWADLDWFNEFDQLDGNDAAFVIAAYRTKMQIDAVTTYFANKRGRRGA